MMLTIDFGVIQKLIKAQDTGHQINQIYIIGDFAPQAVAVMLGK